MTYYLSHVCCILRSWIRLRRRYLRRLDRVARERSMSVPEVIRAIGNGSLAMVGGIIPYRVYNEMMNRPSYYTEEEPEGEGI